MATAVPAITLKDHVRMICESIPYNTNISFEVRVRWDKKLEEYVVSTGYSSFDSTLLRFTVKPERKQ